jgi:hypothetical protein
MIFHVLQAFLWREPGVYWDVEPEQFKCKVVNPCETPTKRNRLKVVTRTFDPLGIFSPFLLPAHQIFQELCRQKLAWDQTFKGDLHDRWLSWLKDFEAPTDFQINRCFKPPGFGEIEDVQLHFFSDAAEKTSYGAVGYIRFVNKEGKIHVALLFGKSRVLPLKPVSSTPRLELIAAALSAKIADQIKMQLLSKISEKISKVCYWTDLP